MAFSQIIARLGVQLGLDTAAFQTGSRRAQREAASLEGRMKTMGKGITSAFAGFGAGLAAVGLSSAVSSAFELASSMSEAAARIGVTVEGLQELRLAAQDSGVSSEQLETAMARLNVQLGDLQAGGKTAAAAFEAIGLTAEDLRGKDPQAALGMIADGLMEIEDPALRAAAAQNLLGKSYAQLLPLIQGGSAALDEAAEASRRQGQISTEDAKKLDDLADAWERLKVRVGVFTANVIADFAKIATEWSGFQDKTWEVFNAVDRLFGGFLSAGQRMARGVVVAIAQMAQGVQKWIGGVLTRVWDQQVARIKAVGQMFGWLYDVVVGHSYVPDMVDGIAAEMARLDAVLVKPAERATEATADSFRALRDTLDRLFPEVAKADRFNADLARITGSALNDNDKDAAVQRLWREFLGGSPFGSGGMGGPEFGAGENPLVQGMGDTADAIEDLTERSKVGTVRIAKSFADMATSTLESLGRLTSAIKGGGFLDIVSAVVGLGVQLGQSGAFGSKVASFLNRAPAFAGGTNFAPGGLSLVGERGPELVNLPRGSKVIPNGKFGGNVYNISGNLLTEEFWRMIEQRDAIAAQAGARGGEARINYRNSRRVG